MAEPRRLGIPGATYLRPLTAGLEDAGFELHRDIPARLALEFRDRPDLLRGAFLSPIDFARHGGNFRVLPGICASSASPTGTVRLYVNPGRANIASIAVDIRVTSEIILARIILLEKFPNLGADRDRLTFIPMEPDPAAMLKKADAALVVSLEQPSPPPAGFFAIDLVEEWNDLTDLPYVHGMWVVREEAFSEEDARALLKLKGEGIRSLGSIEGPLRSYLDAFSYDFDAPAQDAVTE